MNNEKMWNKIQNLKLNYDIIIWKYWAFKISIELIEESILKKNNK